jgi:hypothetical protein
MAIKKMRLPKEGVVASEGQPRNPGPDMDTDTDVEGHGFFNPAPPAGFSKRSPSAGGDVVPADENAKADRPA